MPTTMTARAAAATAGGTLLFGAALSPFAIASGGEQMSEVVQGEAFRASFAAAMVSIVAMLVLLPSLRTQDPTSAAARAAYWCATGATLLLFGTFFAIVFVLPEVAELAASTIDDGPPIGVQLSFLVFGPAWLWFAIVCRRTGELPRGPMTLLAVGAALAIGPILPLGLLVMSFGFIGLANLRRATAEAV